MASFDAFPLQLELQKKTQCYNKNWLWKCLHFENPLKYGEKVFDSHEVVSHTGPYRSISLKFHGNTHQT